MYEPSQRITKQIAGTFHYHAPRPDQIERYAQLRAKACEFAELIATLTPESREQAVALTKLQETVMFANAAIAITEAVAEFG